MPRAGAPARAVRSCSTSRANATCGGSPGQTRSLKFTVKSSSSGWLSEANAVAAAVTLSRWTRMLLLQSITRPTVAGRSSLEKKSMFCNALLS